jgi:acyl-CoA thioesterase
MQSATSNSTFDTQTAPTRDADGRWTASIGEELSGFGGTHGGYLLALGLRTMSSLVADRDRLPRSVTAHLLTPVRPGAVELRPRLERSGSSMTATSLRMEQNGEVVATALASFGRARPSPNHLGAAMPGVPPPDDLRPLIEKPVAEARAGLLVEHRPAGPPLPFTGGERAQIVVWMRLVEERPVDALSASMLADAGPPAMYGRLSSYIPMPSADMTLQFADLAAAARSPWVLGVFRTAYAGDGYATEDGELWTPDGRLVLLARQLRRILRDA